MTPLKELLENRAQNREVYPCEKVLGDLSRVYRMADLYTSNADLIELIVANELLEYCSTETFTTEEYAAFRKGVQKIGEFMGECAKERNTIEALKAAGRPVYKTSP
jgi:hypothetical protein